MKKILLGSLILFGLLAGWCEAPRPYHLIHADRLVVRTVRGEHISDLVGNVHFFYGDTEFFSDFATLYEKQELANLKGRVVVLEDTLRMEATKVAYYNISEQLFLQDSVYVTETHQDGTKRTFTARRVEYFRKTRDFTAIDEVHTWDERENITATCGYLTYNLGTGYGYMMRDPMVQKIQSDTLAIAAQKIEYFDDYQKIVATFNVDVTSSENRITSDFLIYFSNEEKAIFKGQPRFYSSFGDGLAKEFHIFFQKQRLRQAEFIDSCRVDFRAKPGEAKTNWILADRMIFNFIDDAIIESYAEGGVNAMVIQEQSAHQDYGWNHSQGEWLHILFNDDQDISEISLKTRTTGKYRFIND